LADVNIIVINIHVRQKTTPHRTFSCTLHLKPSKRELLSLGDESLTFSLEGEFPTAKATVSPTATDAERKRFRISKLVDAALLDD
jgi:hypothetical protein